MTKKLIVIIFIFVFFLFVLFANPRKTNGENDDNFVENNNNFIVDLFWSADTLTPEDYPGRSLPIKGSFIEIVALSNRLNKGNLYYEWFLDKDRLSFASGLGKNNFSLRITNWPGFKHTVEVRVTDENTAESQTAWLEITVREPEVRLIYPNAIYKGEPVLIQAVTYFFTSPKLNYSWLFNLQPAEGEASRPNELILEIGGSYNLTEGKLDLTVSNPQNIFEEIRKRVIINIL